MVVLLCSRDHLPRVDIKGNSFQNRKRVSFNMNSELDNEMIPLVPAKEEPDLTNKQLRVMVATMLGTVVIASFLSSLSKPIEKAGQSLLDFFSHGVRKPDQDRFPSRRKYYDTLYQGMPRKSASILLGPSTKTVMETSNGDPLPFTMAIYLWEFSDGAAIQLTFRDNELIAKMQHGLD